MDQHDRDEIYKDRFQKGSKPDVKIEDIRFIRNALNDTVENYKGPAGPGDSRGHNDLFVNAGLQITRDEMMRFLLFHEKMHYSRIAMLVQFIKK